MRSALRYFISEQPVATGLCLTALAFTLFFGFKFLLHVVWLNDPAHRAPDLEGWMRPRYVSMTYRIPPHVLAATLGIEPPGEEDRKRRAQVTMSEVAADLGLDLEALTERVAAAAEDFHGGQGQ